MCQWELLTLNLVAIDFSGNATAHAPINIEPIRIFMFSLLPQLKPNGNKIVWSG